MKIDGITIKNYKGIKVISVRFGEKETHIYGPNKAGKTSLISAFWACFKGVGMKGSELLIDERWRIIGTNGKSANIEVALIDEKRGGAKIKVHRKITSRENILTFEAPDGYTINNAWVESLFSVVFFNARNFVKKSPREQAMSLGINTNTYDADIEDLKEEAKGLRRDIKGFGVIERVEKVEPVSSAKLNQELKAIEQFNLLQDQIEKSHKSYQKEVDECDEEIRLAKEKILQMEEVIGEYSKSKEEAKKQKAALHKPQSKKDTTEIDQKINEADSTNKRAYAYEHYLEESRKLESKQAKLDNSVAEQNKVELRKTGYIGEFDFGFDGLSVDENGGLTLTDKSGVPRHIKEGSFSTAELAMIVPRLYASTKPELKAILIDNFENLDVPNQKKIICEMDRLGLQIITFSVGEPQGKENVVYLRECKVVEGDKKDKKPTLL